MKHRNLINKFLGLLPNNYYIMSIVPKLLIETFLSGIFGTITLYLTPIFINPFRSKLVGIHHTKWFNNCHASISRTSIFLNIHN